MNTRPVAFLIILIAACTGGPSAGRGGEPATPQDSTAYAIRDAFPDSVEQAMVGAFLQSYGSRVIPLQQAGNYLGEVELLRELAAGYSGSSGVRNVSGQQIATYLSFLGRYREAIALFDSVEGSPPDTTRMRSPGSFDLEGAVAAISGAADTAQAIFINEAHHVPQHRALTLALLEPLYARGFRYFAAETFAAADSALNTRGYPLRRSGFYTNEPMFGEVVRTAARLGYTLVPYESSGDRNQNDRERGQAQNLHQRIFEIAPDARVLVHAGYGHINEGGTISNASPMAVHFRELTGLDPVTVDQTTMMEHVDTTLEQPSYRRIVRDRALRVASVLRDSRTRAVWSARPGIHDISVVHPVSGLRQGRPIWLWEAGRRKAVRLPVDVCHNTGSCVASAWLASESEDAIPVDRILVEDGMAPPPLLLSPGSYRLVVKDADGTILSQRDIAVT
jgi:hypothetical protein